MVVQTSGRHEKLSVPPIDAKTVIDEIMIAFRDVPRPDRCIPEDHVAYGSKEDLEYLVGKTWVDIARDVSYMVRHAEEQFFFMERECLYYLFPGYLLGVINHSPESVAAVTQSLLYLLHFIYPNDGGQAAYDLHSYLVDRLTLQQKRVVAHWLQLVLERDKERFPELYVKGAQPPITRIPHPTRLERTFNGWRHWA